MKLSQVLGTLTILTGCISALFFADVPKVIKYNKGDIRNYNTIALHELKKGDLVQGTICLTDGYIAEEEETKKSFGVETSRNTTARFYALYTDNGNYVLYQTGSEYECKRLDQIVDEYLQYEEAVEALEESDGEEADYSGLAVPETALDFTGEVVQMPSDLLPIFQNWYGEGFEEVCEGDVIIRTSNFGRFSWVMYAAFGCAAGALVMLALTIFAHIREKRNQQYGN